MRIRGRRLYPDTLRERRLLMSLGGTPLYAPRGVSPYMLARRLTRAAASDLPDVRATRDLLARRQRTATSEPKGSDGRGGETTRATNTVAAWTDCGAHRRC